MAQYLVIGGSSGIGLQVVRQLAANKDTVFATFHSHEMPSEDGNISYHALNVLDETLDLDFLPDIVDGVVYCPGSINLRPFDRIKPVDFENDYRLQVIGAIKVLQRVLPKLKKSSHPAIILYSTVAVQTGFAFHTQVSASKGAVEGLTKALAAELAPKIRVNCIALSLTDTPLASSLINTDAKREANAQRHPLKKLGTASDAAHLTEFLLSEKSGWITGQVFHLDGGMSALRI